MGNTPITNTYNTAYAYNPYAQQIATLKQQKSYERQMRLAAREASGMVLRPWVGEATPDNKPPGGILGSLGRSMANVGIGAVGFFDNLRKAAFCDENGNFSLGKTVMSVGLMAGVGLLAATVPVAGLALGAVALGFGAWKLGTSVATVAGNYIQGDWQAAEENSYYIGEGVVETALGAFGTTASLRAVTAARGAATTTSLLRNPLPFLKEVKTELLNGQNWGAGFNNIKNGISWMFKGTPTTTTPSAAPAIANSTLAGADDAATVTASSSNNGGQMAFDFMDNVPATPANGNPSQLQVLGQQAQQLATRLGTHVTEVKSQYLTPENFGLIKQAGGRLWEKGAAYFPKPSQPAGLPATTLIKYDGAENINPFNPVNSPLLARQAITSGIPYIAPPVAMAPQVASPTSISAQMGTPSQIAYHSNVFQAQNIGTQAPPIVSGLA